MRLPSFPLSVPVFLFTGLVVRTTFVDLISPLQRKRTQLIPSQDFYTDTLDGKDTFSASSHTDDPVGEFNVTLYERTNLPYGKHTVQLSNTPTNGTAYVDLDWVNIITGDNNANTPNNDIWLDNTASNFTWDDSWRQGTNDFTPEYHDSTFRYVDLIRYDSSQC